MYGEGKILVHEEDPVVTEDGPVLLTRRAPREMTIAKVGPTTEEWERRCV